jgi:hypothetical protein
MSQDPFIRGAPLAFRQRFPEPPDPRPGYGTKHVLFPLGIMRTAAAKTRWRS